MRYYFISLTGKELLGERVSVERARGTPRGSDMWRGSGGGGGGGGRSFAPSPRVRIGRDKYGPPTRTEYRIVVENLSSRVSWQDLKDYMRQAGEVSYADAHKIHRNEGVVEFASYSDMKNAIDKLDGTDLNGRRIRLTQDKSRKKSRSYSTSRSRSRSRSPRTKSKSRSASRSKSREPSKSRSRSRSDNKRSNSEARRDRSRSRSASKDISKSRSRSPNKDNDKNENND